MSGHLVRPVHPIHYDLGFFAGWKVVVIVLWLPIAAVLTLVVQAGAAPDRGPDRRVRVAIWGAYLIRSLLLWMLGMVTFWTTRVGAMFEAYFAAELLLSGPAGAGVADAAAGRRRVASFLPFEWMFRLPDHSARRDRSRTTSWLRA